MKSNYQLLIKDTAGKDLVGKTVKSDATSGFLCVNYEWSPRQLPITDQWMSAGG